MTEWELKEIEKRLDNFTEGNWIPMIEGITHDSGSDFIMTNVKNKDDYNNSNRRADIELNGGTKEDVVFIDIAFDDLKDLPEINKLYMELFPENKRPARTIYQAEALPFGGKVKITGTAVKEL